MSPDFVLALVHADRPPSAAHRRNRGAAEREARRHRRRCKVGRKWPCRNAASSSGSAEAREQYVARGVSTPSLVVSRAEGALVWDADGREYLDFAGGIGCLNLGHGHAAILEAVHEQVDRYLHQCFMVGTYEPYVEVCRRLAELSPCRGEQQKSILLN